MKAKLFVEPASATTSEADETAETGSTTTSKAVTSPTVPPTQTSPGSEQRAAVGTQAGEESIPAGSPPTTGNATTAGQEGEGGAGGGNATSQQGQAGAGGGGGSPTLTILEGSSIQGNPDYDPDQLTVKKGDIIQVNNADTAMPHTVTNGESTTDPNSAKLFDTGIIMGGESAQLDTSNVDAGSHPFYCTVHPYMTGTLTVE